MRTQAAPDRRAFFRNAARASNDRLSSDEIRRRDDRAFHLRPFFAASPNPSPVRACPIRFLNHAHKTASENLTRPGGGISAPCRIRLLARRTIARTARKPFEKPDGRS